MEITNLAPSGEGEILSGWGREVPLGRVCAIVRVEKGGDGRAESAQLTHTIGSEDPISCQQQCFSSLLPTSEKKTTFVPLLSSQSFTNF